MFKFNNYVNIFTLIASLTLVSVNTYASSNNQLNIQGVGQGKNEYGQDNKEKRLPTWMQFYNIPGLTDTKNGVTLENLSQFDNGKFNVKVSSRSGHDETIPAINAASVHANNSGGGINFDIWGKMTLAGYPFLGLIDIQQYHSHSKNWWRLGSNADSGFYKMYASYSDLIFRTANHYKYKIENNVKSKSNYTIIKPASSYEQNNFKMEMPFIHLSYMPEGYYLTEEQAKSKGFDFKAFSKDGDFFKEHQMVVTKPNGDDFYFQTCMPQSNLIYNADTQELNCEYPSGLPEKIPGCTALYYFADGKATMYCENNHKSKSLNPSTVSEKYKKYFLTSNDLYNCKIGSLTADKTNGIKCKVDTSVNQPSTGYNYKNADETIKLLPESTAFIR